jgi:hypothetical protein
MWLRTGSFSQEGCGGFSTHAALYFSCILQENRRAAAGRDTGLMRWRLPGVC